MSPHVLGRTVWYLPELAVSEAYSFLYFLGGGVTICFAIWLAVTVSLVGVPTLTFRTATGEHAAIGDGHAQMPLVTGWVPRLVDFVVWGFFLSVPLAPFWVCHLACVRACHLCFGFSYLLGFFLFVSTVHPSPPLVGPLFRVSWGLLIPFS